VDDVDAQSLTLSIAFLAGLLSFASPCVLPLVPAYIGYLGGTVVMAGEPAEAHRDTARTFLHSLLFVIGFAAVFVLLGASATFIGRLLLDYALLLQRVGGVLLVIFGMRLMAAGWNRPRWIGAAVMVALLTFLFDSRLIVQGSLGAARGEDAIVWLEESVMMGLVVLAGADWGTARQILLATAAGILNFLASFDALIPNLIASLLIAAMAFAVNRTTLFYTEKRLELKQTGQGSGSLSSAPGRGSPQGGYLRSLLFGVVFAAGWTPCIGPILAAILVVASQLQTVGQGVLFLAAYSLGLGIPFLVVGLALGPLSKALRRLNQYVGIVSIVSGVLLVVMGILMFTDSLGFLAQYGNLFQIEFLGG
jgi:cytochrome c-type biogenesis protein